MPRRQLREGRRLTPTAQPARTICPVIEPPPHLPPDRRLSGGRCRCSRSTTCCRPEGTDRVQTAQPTVPLAAAPTAAHSVGVAMLPFGFRFEDAILLDGTAHRSDCPLLPRPLPGQAVRLSAGEIWASAMLSPRIASMRRHLRCCTALGSSPHSARENPPVRRRPARPGSRRQKPGGGRHKPPAGTSNFKRAKLELTVLETVMRCQGAPATSRRLLLLAAATTRASPGAKIHLGPRGGQGSGGRSSLTDEGRHSGPTALDARFGARSDRRLTCLGGGHRQRPLQAATALHASLGYRREAWNGWIRSFLPTAQCRLR